MKTRCEPRIEISRPAEVTILQKPESRFQGHLLNISGRGMRLLLDRPVPLGAAIRVKWDRTLVLGEVCYCNGLPEGKQFAVGLQLDQTLTDTVALARLAQKLLGIEYEPVTG